MRILCEKWRYANIGESKPSGIVMGNSDGPNRFWHTFYYQKLHSNSSFDEKDRFSGNPMTDGWMDVVINIAYRFLAWSEILIEKLS